MPAAVLVDLSTAMAVIGVMIALFLRADRRIDQAEARFESRVGEVEAKFESRFDKVDARFESVARDLVEVKVSVARIEGYLQAGEGFRPAGRDRHASRPDLDEPPTTYRQAG